MEQSYHMEQSNKLRGFLLSVIVHAALLLIFLFFYLTPPDPPLSEMGLGGGGIELNYGMPDAGTGDPTNLNPANPETSDEVDPSAPEISEDMSEQSPADEGENLEADVTDNVDAVAIKTANKTTVQTDNKDKKEDKNTNPPAPTVDNKFVMNKSTGKNSGEDKNNPGDPGQKDGTIDGNALHGKPGKGGDGSGIGDGPNLGGGLAGWKFLSEPKVNDQTQEKGTLVFTIYVNEEGIIERANVTQNLGDITPTLQLKYKQVLVGSELISTTGKKMPPRSTGTVTWHINPK